MPFATNHLARLLFGASSYSMWRLGADILNALCWAKKKGVNLKSWGFRPYGNGKASIEIANIIKKKLV